MDWWLREQAIKAVADKKWPFSSNLVDGVLELDVANREQAIKAVADKIGLSGPFTEGPYRPAIFVMDRFRGIELQEAERHEGVNKSFRRREF